MISKCLRAAAAVAFVAAATCLPLATLSQAATLTFANDGAPHVIATVTGTGGTMNFTLDLGDPDNLYVDGRFAMSIFGPPGPVVGPLLGGIDFDGLVLYPEDDFGSIASPQAVGPFLPNISHWSLTVAAPDLPLSIVVTALLNSLAPSPNPFLLTVNFDGDLQIAPSAVPIPGAIPLFASGLGLIGFLARRRSRQTAAQAAA